MALYLLNMSVDAPDKHPHYIAEDLSFNDQESILEIIIEQLMGFENAIMEHDDHDATSKLTLKKTHTVDFFVFSSDGFLPNIKNLSNLKINTTHFFSSFSNPFIEHDAPPPKAQA